MNKNIELYSFDIFDTLITRRVGIPKGIFALMQEEIKDKIILPKDFYTIRCESERLAREIGNYREITFDDIYKKMQVDYNLSDETIEYLKDLEIKTELENLVGIEENISKVKTLIEQGEKVVLISDMYHSSDTIRMFLSHISPIFEKVKIYVSSEYKTSKWEGKLFKIVQEKENIKPQNWLHCGDNKISDIKHAGRQKIKTECFEYPELMKYEEELLGLFPENACYQMIVGASRLARLNKCKNKEKYDFGASFTAPIIYNYVNWILEESLKKGFKTLHFIARDGYIPKIVADMIIEKRGLDIKTKYIYGSRLAWRVPCEENYEKLVQIALNEYRNKLSLSFLAYRLGVNSVQFQEFLKVKDIDKIFNEKECELIEEKLLQDRMIKSFILESNKEKSELLKEYLKQELDLDNNDCAFVDINGSGRTQDIITEYIYKLKNVHIHTFYLTTSTNDNINTNKKYTYCIEPKPHYHCLELLCRTLDGQTLGYFKKENIVMPRTEVVDHNLLLEWGFNEYLKGIIESTKNMLDLNIDINNVELLYIYHDFITLKCTSDVAAILGDIPFLTIGDEKSIKQAAPELSLWQIVKHFLYRNNLENISDFPFITLARGNTISNFIKVNLKKLQHTPNILFELKFLLLIYSQKSCKMMLWGASLWLKDFITKYKIKNKNILGIIDKNPNRQGGMIGNYNIYAPNIIDKIKPDSIVLTIKNRNKSIYYELKKELMSNHPDIKFETNIFEESWKN